MNSSNPVLNERVFSESRSSGGATMTVSGAIDKTMILFVLLLASASWIWFKVAVPTDMFGDPTVQVSQKVIPFLIGSSIVGFLLALVTMFKKQWAAVSAPLYAVCQGIVLGSLSSLMELKFPGIVIQATGLTFTVLGVMLFLYRARIIQATEKFRSCMMVATLAIGAVYLASFVLGFFGRTIPFIHESGMMGIGFSLIVVGIAAFNLILDFDLIERGAEMEAPKYMEWFSAFALMVTMIWLYIEILRLLSKLRDRR